MTSPLTYEVPKDVVKKWSVEYTGSSSIEDIIHRKIEEESVSSDEAFYIVDLAKVIAKYRQWHDHLPRVTPFYAIKCNPNVTIIKTLAAFGVNFDCASQSEISTILGCGIAPSRIIFANPTKMTSHVRFAKAMGVEMMTFDNREELIKIASIYPEAKLVLRIITDDSNSVHKFSSKFGAPLDACEELISTARDLNLNVIGVSFHVGSGCMSVSSFHSAITNSAKIFALAKSFGYDFKLLDIGGGWPGNDSESPIAFNDIADSTAPLLDMLFDEGVEIIAEPGRYFVAESHVLVANTFAKRSNTLESGETRFLYYINEGVYQSFNCIYFDHYNPKPLLLAPRSEDLYRCTMFGPTCDSLDCLGKDILLPEIEVGDWLYFKDMGAYTVSAASAFNGFKAHPNTFYIESDAATL